MSKLFYDNLIVFEEIETIIKLSSSSEEEKGELWELVDEFLNHSVMEKILDKLPREHHEEFLAIFHKSPSDETIIFGYLEEKVGKDFKTKFIEDLKQIGEDIKLLLTRA